MSTHKAKKEARGITKSPLADLAKDINAEHAQVQQAIRSSLLHAHTAGEMLLQAKELVAHGEWLPWLKKNCCFSERTAQAYMAVARHWPELEAKAQHVADLNYRDAIKLLAHTQDPNEATAPEAPNVCVVVQSHTDDPADVDLQHDNDATKPKEQDHELIDQVKRSGDRSKDYRLLDDETKEILGDHPVTYIGGEMNRLLKVVDLQTRRQVAQIVAEGREFWVGRAIQLLPQKTESEAAYNIHADLARIEELVREMQSNWTTEKLQKQAVGFFGKLASSMSTFGFAVPPAKSKKK